MPVKPCHCGSGLPRYDLVDARGIFCTYVCEKCEQEKRSHYRPDIFTDSNYWAGEQIEPDGDDLLNEAIDARINALLSKEDNT